MPLSTTYTYYIRTSEFVRISGTIRTLSVNGVYKSHYICSDLEYILKRFNWAETFTLGNTKDSICFMNLEQVAYMYRIPGSFFQGTLRKKKTTSCEFFPSELLCQSL